MTDTQPSNANFQASFGNMAMSTMTDSQLRQTISQISSAASRPEQYQTYASPTPQPAHAKAYLKNLHTWSTSTTPPPKSGMSTRPRRANRSSALATTPQAQPAYAPHVYHPQLPPPGPSLPPNPPLPPLPTTPQALYSTYASRLRTGTTLLMQPIIPTASTSTTRATRRGGVVNYVDPGSGDDIPDAGAIDSDDSDFQASGGTRTAIRQSTRKMGAGMTVFHAGSGGVVSMPQQQHYQQQQFQPPEKAELDQSYLGMIPPSKFIKQKPVAPTAHEYPPQEALDAQSLRPTSLVPIRVEFETETHRIRDCFVWNLHEKLIKPEAFARTFCNDLDLPSVPWVETVTNQIRAQLEEHEGVASMDLGVDAVDVYTSEEQGGDEIPECRVILSIDVQVATHHLLDHIEWDLLSPLTPEAFSQKLCTELGLAGEAVPLIAHAIHEEIVKHKKDSIEWGVIGGDPQPVEELSTAAGGPRDRDRSGLSLVKDKTGLGLGWGRAPKDGRGPKSLKSVWRDWAEAEEFRTKFEVLSQEEVDRREIEKERASRRLRRETSKFQSSRTRRR